MNKDDIELNVLVRVLEPNEIIEPTDGIWVFPLEDNYLLEVQHVAPHLIGKYASCTYKQVKRRCSSSE